jgi:hypothetical protein
MSFSLKRFFVAISLIACALALGIFQRNIVDPLNKVPFITLAAMLVGASVGLLARHPLLFAVTFAIIGFIAATYWGLAQFASV